MVISYYKLYTLILIFVDQWGLAILTIWNQEKKYWYGLDKKHLLQQYSDG